MKKATSFVKALSSLISWGLILFAVACGYLRNKYSPPANETLSMVKPAPLGKMKAYPARYNKTFVADSFWVANKGHFFLDFFDIHTFRAVDRNGTAIRMFQGDTPNPDTGSVVLVKQGMFELLTNSSSDQEIVVFVYSMEVLDPENIEVKAFAKKARAAFSQLKSTLLPE